MQSRAVQRHGEEAEGLYRQLPDAELQRFPGKYYHRVPVFLHIQQGGSVCLLWGVGKRLHYGVLFMVILCYAIGCQYCMGFYIGNATFGYFILRHIAYVYFTIRHITYIHFNLRRCLRSFHIRTTVLFTVT